MSLDLHSNAESFAKLIIFRETHATPTLFLLKNAPKRTHFHIIQCFFIVLRPKLLTEDKLGDAVDMLGH